MTGPSVSISIDRTSLSLGALAFSGASGGARGIVRFVPPAAIRRLTYMPDVDGITGSEATSSALQQAVLGFDWFPIGAANETAVQAAYQEVVAALGQFSYAVTTQVSGAPAQVWSADPGSISPGGSDGRTYVDLNHLCPVFSVSIPVYPIAGS